MTYDGAPLSISSPEQCCIGYCVEEIGLHDVDRDTAEAVAQRAGQLFDTRIVEPIAARLAARLKQDRP